jgi:hypothetical protein
MRHGEKANATRLLPSWLATRGGAITGATAATQRA